MASCVLCTSLASVFCTQDRAFLCNGCDKTIHAANVISRTHKRLPVCELCKRSAASVYCNEDAAALCAGCDLEVHSANPLPHTTVPIDHALASGLVATAALPLTAHLPKAAAPEQDETSACGEHCMGAGLHHSSSEGHTSLAVVPEMPDPHASAPVMPTTSGASKELKGFWGKDFDALDFEAAWLGNLDVGLDFSDILGNDHALEDAPGMVPSIPHEEQAAMERAKSNSGNEMMLRLGDAHNSMDVLESLADDDFVVPSFLPEDFSDDHLALQLPNSMSQGFKRPATQEIAQPKSSRRAKMSAMPSFYLAPPPPPLSGSSGNEQMMYSPSTIVMPETHGTRKSQEPSKPVLNGAHLTREQRVARYREKRKNRKFQKTIRYASRKAYAEVRPRIKGRFATKEEVAAWKARKAAGIAHEDDDLMIFS